MLDLVVALLACVVAAEYLVIGLFIVPRLARLADGRGTKVVLLAQIGAAGFFFGCAVTHITVLVVELRGGADANAGWHLVPHVLQVVGGAVFIWAVFTQRLSVQLLEQRGIEAEQTRTRLAAIVRHSDDVILAKDRKGRITAWNAAASRLYGYSAAEAIGQSVSLIVPGESCGGGTAHSQTGPRGRDPHAVRDGAALPRRDDGDDVADRVPDLRERSRAGRRIRDCA